jgi:hypothetical protein
MDANLFTFNNATGYCLKYSSVTFLSFISMAIFFPLSSVANPSTPQVTSVPTNLSQSNY